MVALLSAVAAAGVVVAEDGCAEEIRSQEAAAVLETSPLAVWNYR